MTTIAPPLPPAPAGPPPPLSPGGRTAVRVVLTVAATVLVVGCVAALGVVAWGLSTFRVITDSQPLPAAMRSLVVDTGSVPVAVRITTDRQAREPRADLRMVNSTRAGAKPLAVTTDGADARVTINGESSPFLQWSRGGEITVVLPPDLARRLTVTTEQDNGVVLAQADLDALIARTDNGAIVLSGSARRIEVYTDNGEVVTREPISVRESFTATTSNGNVNVDFADAAPRTVDATSDNGDVVVALPARGPYVVNASTDNGDTSVRVPRASDPETAAAVVTVRSDNGDVVVETLR
ncbi:DUF4097 family beta strand repeat-containing protein [Mycobacterium hubeiense]|uniref:DUF4097 family beta strand repeat-containing protein n=1 Tax=Mycobacterium hubeiense TaxID=1867256 RepID=UPI000C7E9B6B|nr:DUF4097 family beta strand repeat-containing protein [Mycobacterium sp. QGD 101]